MIIGYTTGVFDLFHVGHVRMLYNAKSMCDKLVVGVTTDELMIEYKKKRAIIPFSERIEIVSKIKAVDAVIPQRSMDKMDAWNRIKFDLMFVGDDWYQTEKWNKLEEQFKEKGVRIIYFPYTKGTSSTLLNQVLQKLRSQKDIGQKSYKEIDL